MEEERKILFERGRVHWCVNERAALSRIPPPKAKEQMTPLYWPGLSCYCTLIVGGIVLLECILPQCCASTLRGEEGECPSRVVGSLSLSLFPPPPPTKKTEIL